MNVHEKKPDRKKKLKHLGNDKEEAKDNSYSSILKLLNLAQ